MPIPVLVGCGQITDRETPVEAARSPVELIAQAARLAIDDAGGRGLLASIDTVAVPRLFSDSSFRFATRLGGSSNPPHSVARRLGCQGAQHVYSHSGGNMPQSLVNQLADAIAGGHVRTALLAGGEALRTQHALERAGHEGIWRESPGGHPEMVGDDRRGWNDTEERHNARAAITMYPLLENAIRAGRGHAVDQHLRSMGRLFARFAQVAAGNPLATRREAYTAERLATVDQENRWIGFPYPRLLTANAFIDQAAAVVMTSDDEARRLGIPADRWVYLHGCADAHDTWHVSQRATLDRSPAIARTVADALRMAGRTLDDIALLDVYSCFPSAVEVACREIGLAEDDPRGLTVTGGLPYFGGPGNNYVTHAIAEMMQRLRERPGSFGMVTANGFYLTKHSVGIYSTRPCPGLWRRGDPTVLQRQLDALPTAPLAEEAEGPATIETYTVMHGKAGPEYAVVFGRLAGNGRRFVANTPDDSDTLVDLQHREGLGRRGTVRRHQGRNIFVPSE